MIKPRDFWGHNFNKAKMRSRAALQASCALSDYSRNQRCPRHGEDGGSGKEPHGSRTWRMGGPRTSPSTVYWGQLAEAFNCAGSGVLVAIYHNPAQMLKIGQMNHALKVPVSADYKGSLGWPAPLEMSALWIYEIRWEKSHISHCFISVSYLEQSLFKIKGCPRLQGYLILYWAA